jgi:thiamine transporter ThiT
MAGVNVPVGASTVAGGSVSLVAFALAIVAFITGARDEATIGALVTGLVSLVTTLAGRFAQATAVGKARNSQ